MPITGINDHSYWELYASADEDGSPNPLRFFGPLGFAQQDATAKRVVRVMAHVVEGEPDPSDYWAWLDHGAWQPCHIAPTEEEMTKRFLIGQSGAPGPREEQEAELGRILRLRVVILEEVYLRSGRRNWRITSAM
jgi:hypothetical protein